MLLIYFLLGLSLTTAHSDYGVSFRAQNFDKTVKNIDKGAYINHQREKRHITGYFVPQNGTNRPSWGSNSSRDFVANITRFQYENRPSRYNGVIPNTNTEVIPNTDTEEAPNDQRVKRFATGYFVPQNITNKPAWGNFTITRNNMTYIPANTITNLEQNSLNTGTRPNNNVTVIYPGQPGYVNPLQNNTGLFRPFGNMTDVAENYFNQLQNTNVTRPVTPDYIHLRDRNVNNTSGYTRVPVNPAGYTRVPVNPATPGHTLYPGYNATGPVYPKPNNIIVRPANNNNFSNSNPSGYSVQPVNRVTPGNNPYYPVPNTGYPASNTGNLAPNTGYPAPNTVYPVPNTSYPASNTRYPAASYWYPAPGTVNPVPNTVYPVPNTGYPATNTQYTNTGYPSTSGYPPPSFVLPKTNITGFVPKPIPGVTIYDVVHRNNSSGFNNNVSGFNNTASLANCKCKLPRANSTITKEETTMDACMIACNNCPTGMKMSAFGVCVKDLDYDDE